MKLITRRFCTQSNGVVTTSRHAAFLTNLRAATLAHRRFARELYRASLRRRNCAIECILLGTIVALTVVGTSARLDAGILHPTDFSSLGAFPTAPGAYTLNTDGFGGYPTLTGPGTFIQGVYLLNSAASYSGKIAVFNFDRINIVDGMTIKGGSGQSAVAFLSETSFAISSAGLIDVSGGAGTNSQGAPNGGARGAGAGAGGQGGNYTGSPGESPTDNGGGQGGGEFGSGPVVGGGGGGGSGGQGGSGGGYPGFQVGGTGGKSAIGYSPQTLVAGSGGGGGGTTMISGAGGGGGGGGAIEISALANITINGNILAFGGHGGNAAQSDPSQPSGGGGGGSGGAIILDGRSVTLNGLLDVRGGGGGYFSFQSYPYSGGGGGGGGRVLIDATNGFFGGTQDILVSGGNSVGSGGNGSAGVITINSVPEPSGLILTAIALLCMIVWDRWSWRGLWSGLVRLANYSSGMALVLSVFRFFLAVGQASYTNFAVQSANSGRPAHNDSLVVQGGSRMTSQIPTKAHCFCSMSWWLALFGLFVTSGLSAGEILQWSDVTGKYAVQAELLRVEKRDDGEIAILKKKNGKTVAVPLAKLSNPSREQATSTSRIAPRTPDTAEATLPVVQQAAQRIKSSPRADERLFLLRVLEVMYEEWPADASDPKQFVEATTDLRKRALKFKQHAEDAKLDPELAQLFADYVDALDSFRNFLENIGTIEKTADTEAGEDEFRAGFKGGLSGTVTYSALKQGDYSTSQALGAALIVGAVNYFLESRKTSQARDDVKEHAVAAEAQRLSDKVMSALMRAQNVAQSLTARYGWERGEAGFELSETHAKRVQDLVNSSDVRGLTRLADEIVAIRPRDPMVRLQRNLFASLDPAASAELVLKHAKDSDQAASLVPAAAVYDENRQGCISVAALLALIARQKEISSGIAPLGTTEAGRCAVELCREVLKSEPTDPSGEIRELLAIALMDANELSEAVSLARNVFELRRTSADFCYFYGCLMSRTGDASSSVQFLKQAIALGFCDVTSIKRDPNLTLVRGDKAREVAEFTSVKFKWSIGYGVFNDDISLTNESPFTLTNSAVHVDLEQDGRKWALDLKADLIAPGETHTWQKAVSIPRSRLTKAGATILCDQNR